MATFGPHRVPPAAIDGGGVEAIQCHLNAIESAFFVLSLSDKQRALQLIVTFLQKLEINTYNAPSEDLGDTHRVVPVGNDDGVHVEAHFADDQRLILVDTSADSAESTLLNEDESLAAYSVSAVDFDVQPSGDNDGVEPNGQQLIVDDSQEPCLVTPSHAESASLISKIDKVKHLDSDFVWGEECEDDEGEKRFEEEETSWNCPAKVLRIDANGDNEVRPKTTAKRALTARRNRRKAPTASVRNAEGTGDSEGHVDGIRLCDGRDPEDVEVAEVIDEMIDCLEKGTQYRGDSCQQVRLEMVVFPDASLLNELVNLRSRSFFLSGSKCYGRGSCARGVSQP